MLKMALSISFSVVNVMKRAQVHPTLETSCDSLKEKKDKRATGNCSGTDEKKSSTVGLPTGIEPIPASHWRRFDSCPNTCH